MFKGNCVGDAEHSEAAKILRNLCDLREQIVTAWGERAVILSPEEQVRLRREIHETCEMLTTITRLR